MNILCRSDFARAASQVRAIAYTLQLPGSALPGLQLFAVLLASSRYSVRERNTTVIQSHNVARCCKGCNRRLQATAAGEVDTAKGQMVVTVKCGEMTGDIPTAAALRQAQCSTLHISTHLYTSLHISTHLQLTSRTDQSVAMCRTDPRRLNYLIRSAATKLGPRHLVCTAGCPVQQLDRHDRLRCEKLSR